MAKSRKIHEGQTLKQYFIKSGMTVDMFIDRMNISTSQRFKLFNKEEISIAYKEMAANTFHSTIEEIFGKQDHPINRIEATAQQLIIHRAKLGLSQTDIINQLEKFKIMVSQRTYSHYEAGTVEPAYETIVALAKLYQTPELIETLFPRIII